VIYEQRLEAVNPLELAARTNITKIPRFALPIPPVVRPFLLTNQFRGCSCHSDSMHGMIPPDYGVLRGLGQDSSMLPGSEFQVPSTGSGNISVLNAVAVGANFIPGVGTIASLSITTITQMISRFEAWLHIGAGRTEANIIVPVQNNLMAQLGQITNQILTGTNPTADQLIGFYRNVWVLGVAFQEFVLMKNFTDRRASGQALNTVMPYIDGTCGYPVPVGPTAYPGQSNCLSWGDGTVGGVGTNGMLGAIGRAIVNAGGTVPVFQDLHVAANSGIPGTALAPGQGGGVFSSLPPTIMGVSTPLALVIGVAALFLYSKGSL